MTGAFGLRLVILAAISEVETNAPGPALEIISRRSSSKADLRAMGRTEALVRRVANTNVSSSDFGIVAGTGELNSAEEEKLWFILFKPLLNARVDSMLNRRVKLCSME